MQNKFEISVDRSQPFAILPLVSSNSAAGETNNMTATQTPTGWIVDVSLPGPAEIRVTCPTRAAVAKVLKQ